MNDGHDWSSPSRFLESVISREYTDVGHLPNFIRNLSGHAILALPPGRGAMADSQAGNVGIGRSAHGLARWFRARLLWLAKVCHDGKSRR
jgi:hypothetical protein